MNQSPQVFLNRFPIGLLREDEKTVYCYRYSFNSIPEPGQEFKAINRITWEVRAPATRLGETIITKIPIAEEYLQGENWQLELQGTQLLDISNLQNKQALEKLERRWLEQKLKKSYRFKVERSVKGGFILWNNNNIILKNQGLEVHTGVHVDLEIRSSGKLILEIDIHHRFYTPWTLQEWFDSYGKDFPLYYIRNTYDQKTWAYVRNSDEKAEAVQIPNVGISLADYHLKKTKIPATESEINNAQVVYVRNNKKKQEIAHLSTRLLPSVTMETLRYLSELGQKEAKDVFKQLRKPIQERFNIANKTAVYLSKNIYKGRFNSTSSKQISIKPQMLKGVDLHNKAPILLTRTFKVHKAAASLKQGCLNIGETKFGCLDLIGHGKWPQTIIKKLQEGAEKSQVNLELETPKTKSNLPDSPLKRQQFWQDWSKQGTNTILVVTNWLGDHEKIKLTQEALSANIALQFMVPKPNITLYHATNVVLGMLVKAKWQPVGLEPLSHPKAAEIAIGFDAGTNRNLYYGTSAFAVLANGQSLGWELPEAQPGEKISGQAVLRAVTNIITRFRNVEKRLPKQILILRDGLIQDNEFEQTMEMLKQEKIRVDLLEVRKSGAGRMAIKDRNSGHKIDAKPGTAVFSNDGKTFRIVTSRTIGNFGGSVRPLQIVHDKGDTPLELLARQIYRLTQLHPASGYSSSRLPMVLHYADKMAKYVQQLGEISCLQNVDRYKIFF